MSRNVTDRSISIDPGKLKAKVTDLIHREAGRLIFITDADGIVTSYGDGGFDEVPIDADDCLGRRVDDVIERVRTKEDDVTSIEDRIFFGTLKGEIFKFKSSPISTKDGPGTAYFIILKKVEDMAQDYIDKAEESKILFENSPLAMALVDPKMRANTVNDAARDLLHIKVDADLENGKCGELIGCYNSTYGKGCGTNRPCKDCVIRNTVNATFRDRLPRDKVEGDFMIERNGFVELRRIQVWTRLVGNQTKVLLALNDISDVITVERSLLEANKKLNLMSSITRHDNLNSLTTLSLLVELASDVEGLDETAQGYLRRMQGVVRDLGQQINFTKAYQDLGTQEPQWHLLTRVISDSVPEDMSLKMILDESLDNMEILADPMLPRVFHNLIENVIRHGENATTLKVSAENGEGDVKILIQDNGIGVADCDKVSIFNRGFGKNSGLGLFLSKEILSITDLGLSEVGEYGKGACFRIDVPLTSHRSVG